MITYRWYRNALSKGTCDLFRTIGETKILEEAKTRQGISKTRKSSVAFFNNVETKIVQDNIMPYINECNATVRWNFKLDFLENAQFTTYHSYKGDNQYYGWHKDWCCRVCSRDEDGNEPDIKGPRKISCSILLSSSDEYEGGELKIVNGDISRLEDGVLLKSDDANIKNKGDMVILRSDAFHRVAPVTKGVRKSLVLWFSGPEFT
jgi:PKHD-type hydroxylase